MRRAFALCVVGLVTTAAPSFADVCGSVAGNLVANCGFESGTFSLWTQSGNTWTTAVSALSPSSGNFDGLLGPIGSDGFLSQTITTTPGTFYDLHFWLRNNSSVGPNEFVAYWDNIPVFSLLNSSAFGFTNEYIPSLLGSGSDTLLFAFRNDPSFWHLDDISLTALNSEVLPTPEPTSLTLLGTALIANALRRRSARRRSADAVEGL